MSKSDLSMNDNIPVLTNPVRSTVANNKASQKLETETSDKTPGTDKSEHADTAINRKRLEKLIQKKLQQMLPQLSQELTKKIISELSDITNRSSPQSTGKSKSRR